jgi:Peptidase inhibitor family I36
MGHVLRSSIASLRALLLVSLLGALILTAAPGASASLSQCPSNAMCVWEGRNYDGNFSWWAASDTGCHTHAGNSQLRSGWNRTSYGVDFGGWWVPPNIGPVQIPSGYVTGPVCMNP